MHKTKTQIGGTQRQVQHGSQIGQTLVEGPRSTYLTDSYREVMTLIKNVNDRRGDCYEEPSNNKAAKALAKTLSRIERRGVMDKVKDLSPLVRGLAEILDQESTAYAHPEILRVIKLTGNASAVRPLLMVSERGPEGNSGAIDALKTLRRLDPSGFDREFAKALLEGGSPGEASGALYAFDELGMDDSHTAVSALLSLRKKDRISGEFREEVTTVLLGALMKRTYAGIQLL